MEWKDGLELINKALEKEEEQKDWEVWISIYPDMTEKNFISFRDYRIKKNSPPKKEKEKLTNEQIIANAESKRKIHQGEHKGIVRD